MSRNSQSVTFVLPAPGTTPSGGPKVVYEYANALVRRGHHVSVVHPAFLKPDLTVAQKVKGTVRYIQRHIDKSYRPDTWFKLDPRVHLLWRPSLKPRYIPDADIVVATWWRTAEYVSKYPASKGRQFYLIQGLETWNGQEDLVMATWHLPLQRVVISHWLHDIASGLKEKAIYIPNGLDFNAFGLDTPLEQRPINRVLMSFHPTNSKGSSDGLSALHLARQKVPSLEADLFGVSPSPEGLPSWIRYHRNPPQSELRSLYNKAAIFLAPSWSEGWGLPASEAMQCGCALVATDIGGHREFCVHDTTALLSPPKDSNAMAKNLLVLLQDQQRSIRLARAGNAYIQQFTWERATDAFESSIADA